MNRTTNTHGQMAEGRTPYQVGKAGLNDVWKAAEAKKDDDKTKAASTLDAALARAERQICGVLVHPMYRPADGEKTPRMASISRWTTWGGIAGQLVAGTLGRHPSESAGESRRFVVG